jgi:3-oxoacyl-(acyl-carrier-protein) synthase
MSAARARVAVTGIGLVTPLGNDAETAWHALLAGESGVAGIAGFDASGFPVRIAAEVKHFSAAERIRDRKLERFAGRAQGFAVAAADEALADAGIRPDDASAARWGCTVGSGMIGVGFDELRDFHARYAPDGALDPGRLFAAGAPPVDPIAFCRVHPSAGLALLTQRFRIRGHAASVHTACASGGQAIAMGVGLIRRGACDRVLAGGFDSMVSPVGLAGFCLLGALSPDNDTPASASRPFDRTRNGFVLGEGAAFLVLEEWCAARERRARIYAELAGQGSSLSGYRITDSHPSGDGPIQAMRRALADAGAVPADVDYVNAHGTSTPMNDRSECAAIRAVFGAAAERVRVSSTKSLMGHLISAAGAVEAALCALAIRDSIAPVNANMRLPDPACELHFVRDEPLRGPIRVALSNSFGFGGSNSCLVLRHPGEVPE